MWGDGETKRQRKGRGCGEMARHRDRKRVGVVGRGGIQRKRKVRGCWERGGVETEKG